ncbi:FkbM family methyltransferase [Roseibium sp. Sym1]|uniref:FkbM family methyltransferase n=1 Tax=Roseibium sp. Sym1 TaxID=3016006 RepID=UPI0022B5B934|nr:FkbM family methyltransferase [Roseibium sp. Sym1]
MEKSRHAYKFLLCIAELITRDEKKIAVNKTQGWYVPDIDKGVPRFVHGVGKSNKFQINHLKAAFKYVTKWRVALDIGAHCGFWTASMAKRFDEVHAFEMAPDTFECLRINMSEKHNVTEHHIGVGEEHGTGSICEDEKRKGSTGSRFIGPGEDFEVTAIDEFAWPAVDLIKIDVEGYEYQVLKGARETIEKFRPVVIMETGGKFARSRYGTANDAAEKFLLKRGYKVAEDLNPDKIFVPNM